MSIPVYDTIQNDEALLFGSYRRTAGRFLHYRLASLTNRANNWADREPTEGNGAVIPKYGSGTSEDMISDTNVEMLLDIDPAQDRYNPVLTGSSVTDFGSAAFVADPFLFPDQMGDWHLFFEVFDANRSPDAAIGHATLSECGQWEYDQVVLSPDHHVSFPFIFESNGDIFMLPEQYNPESVGTVELYVAEIFPTDWQPVEKLVDLDIATSDAILFQWDGRWWLFVDVAEANGTLLAFYSDSLLGGDWKPHEANPIVENRPGAARPGGRPIVTKDRLFLFFQDMVTQYGHRVWLYEVTELSTSSYMDRKFAESPILEPVSRTFSWNSGRMHHIDPWFVDGRWYCAVDGNIGFGTTIFTERNWSIGMLSSP